MSRKTIERNIAYDERNRLFYVTFNYGMDASGKRVKKTKTYDTHIAASQALQIFEEKRRKNEIVIPAEITVGMWLDQWLQEVIVPNRARTTSYGYCNMVKNHIKPVLGNTVLAELTPQQIQSYYHRKRDEGLSANTVHKHHQLLFTALECAVKQEVLSRNPARRVEAPPKEAPRHTFYTIEQLCRLFHAVEGMPLEPAVKLAGYLGLRRSEICGLRWENVDLKTGTIAICAARTTVGGVTITKGPKTNSSVRTLGIAGMTDLENLLHTMLAVQEEYRRKNPDFNPDGYVLVHSNGHPYAPDYISGWFTQFVKQNGLPHLTFHGLRHSFASAANELHIPMFKISKALGHSNTSVTSQVYTHLFDDTQNEVLSQVANALSTGSRREDQLCLF